jgi:hypothetical protein
MRCFSVALALMLAAAAPAMAGGWQDLDWGMSRAQIEARHGDAVETLCKSEDRGYQTKCAADRAAGITVLYVPGYTFGNIRFFVKLSLVEDRLTEVRMYANGPSNLQVRQALVSQYGNPIPSAVKNDETWNTDTADIRFYLRTPSNLPMVRYSAPVRSASSSD